MTRLDEATADFRPHQLCTVTIGDTPQAWADAGFTVIADQVHIDNTVIRLVGGPDRGILSAGIQGIDADVDGLGFVPGVEGGPVGPENPHPNRVDGIDHLVAMSPSMDRTTQALERAGIELRRVRRFSVGEEDRRQAFFWLGDVILELVGPDDGESDEPAGLWGLALSCADLDAASALLGERLGRVKAAIQKGRSIATLRTGELDISIPIALMSPHQTT